MSLIWLHILFVNREIILIDLSCLGNNDPPPLELISNSLKSKTHVLIIAMKMFVRLVVLFCSVCSRWFVIFIPFKCIFHGHNQFSRVMSKSALFLSFSDAIATMRDFLSHVYTNIGYVWLKAMSMYICYIHALSLKIDGIWCDATRRFSLCNQMPKLQFSVSFRFGGNTSRFHDLCVEATGDIKFRATHQYKYASDARLKYLSHLVLLTRERERFSICEFDDFHFGHQWYIE